MLLRYSSKLSSRLKRMYVDASVFVWVFISIWCATLYLKVSSAASTCVEYIVSGLWPVMCAWRTARASNQRSTWVDQLVLENHSLSSNARLRSPFHGRSVSLQR